jgi:transcriptional regulator with XRE-family HTH domain
MSKVLRNTGAFRLREYLKKRRLTQTAAAAEMDMSVAHLNEILSGKAYPSLDASVRIQNITGIPASTFARVA